MRNKRRRINIRFVITLLAVIAFIAASIEVFHYLKGSFYFRVQKANILIVTDNSLSVFSFSDGESVLVKFPLDKKVLVPAGYGEYELGKIYRLGELDKKGGLLTLETLRSSLGLPVTGYLSLAGGEEKIGQGPQEFRKYLMSAMKGESNSNLKLRDLVILLARSYRLSPINFRTTNYQEGQTEVYKDGMVRKEALSMEILNATDHNGLAQKVSLFWENMGGHIVRTADTKESVGGQCKVIFNEEVGESYTLWVMRSFFKCETKSRSQTDKRVDLSLVLGEGYWKKIAEKW